MYPESVRFLIVESWTVYILACADGKTYIGCTNNFVERLTLHRNGYAEFTKTRLPVSVVLTIVFPNKYKAYTFEKYLKSGSGRAFLKRHFV